MQSILPTLLFIGLQFILGFVPLLFNILTKERLSTEKRLFWSGILCGIWAIVSSLLLWIMINGKYLTADQLARPLWEVAGAIVLLLTLSGGVLSLGFVLETLPKGWNRTKLFFLTLTCVAILLSLGIILGYLHREVQVAREPTPTPIVVTCPPTIPPTITVAPETTVTPIATIATLSSSDFQDIFPQAFQEGTSTPTFRFDSNKKCVGFRYEISTPSCDQSNVDYKALKLDFLFSTSSEYEDLVIEWEKNNPASLSGRNFIVTIKNYTGTKGIWIDLIDANGGHKTVPQGFNQGLSEDGKMHIVYFYVEDSKDPYREKAYVDLRQLHVLRIRFDAIGFNINQSHHLCIDSLEFSNSTPPPPTATPTYTPSPTPTPTPTPTTPSPTPTTPPPLPTGTPEEGDK